MGLNLETEHIFFVSGRCASDFLCLSRLWGEVNLAWPVSVCLPHTFFFFRVWKLCKIALLKNKHHLRACWNPSLLRRRGDEHRGRWHPRRRQSGPRRYTGRALQTVREAFCFYCARHLPQPCPSREKRSVVNDTGQFYPFHTIVHYRLFQDRAIHSESPNADEKVLICKGA